MIEDIKKIISAGVRAPSGDNSQPWRFAVSGNSIRCYNLPEKDNPIFNYKQRGSHVAHGALIENMVIAAKEFGYSVKVELFPDTQDDNCVSRLVLERGSLSKDGLYESVWQRAINRKKFANTPLTADQIIDLSKTVDEAASGKVKVIFIDQPDAKKIFGEASSKNEIVMLENKHLHHYFFNDVRWTDEEERKYACGLYAKTMELAPPQLAVFKILSHWRVCKILTKLGIAKFIASENAKIYSTGGAAGVIVVSPQGTKEEFVLAGRVMERLWLKATKMGLGFHPITGIAYLIQRILDDANEILSTQHIELINASFAQIKKVFGVNEETIVIPFRIGDGGSSSGMSSRLEPTIIFEP